jgi:hypothetical protein
VPLLNVFSSGVPADRQVWLKKLSALLARELDKPEAYVMVILNPRPDMTFGGSAGPACYAELKNVGTLAAEQVEDLSRKLGGELAAGLGVPADRVYIEFTNADGALWGWNGSTFA